MKEGEGKNQSLLEEGDDSESRDMDGIIGNILGCFFKYASVFFLGFGISGKSSYFSITSRS